MENIKPGKEKSWKEKMIKKDADEQRMAKDIIKAAWGNSVFRRAGGDRSRYNQEEAKFVPKPTEGINNNLTNNTTMATNPEAAGKNLSSPEARAPETPEIPKAPRAQSRQREEATRSFVPDTRGRFDRLKDWAKERVASLYEKAGTRYEESFVGAVTTEGGAGLFNRVEAAFNDKLMKWHEGKAGGIAQKLDNAKNKLTGFEEIRKSLEKSLADAIENARQHGIPATGTDASVRRQLREWDERIAKTQTDINKYQSRLESRNNSMSGYANARDRACDNMRNRYDEKLKPWEKDVEALKKYSEGLNVETERIEFRRDQTARQLEDFSQRYQRFMTGSQIRDAVSVFTDQLRNWNDQLDRIAKEKSVIDGKISRSEDRANVYRDRKDKLAGYTTGRPAQPESGERARTEPHGEREEIKTESDQNEDIEDIEVISRDNESPGENISTQNWLNKWNEYLKEKNTPEEDLIDESVWRNWIGTSNSLISFGDFKKSLDQYYNIKALNMPRKNFTDNIDGFEEKRKQEESENAS